jgi:hypothetical protein
MPMQAVHELEAVGRTGRLSNTLAPSALILILMLIVCMVLALDASLTQEQRIVTFQQSGVFP